MIPSAAPYSVTWNTELQVTTESPPCAGFLLSGIWLSSLPVGASWLAMVVNDNA